ncbi:hypothetical protein BJ875DRAFT_459126 [Amylocarpus encephaloides]|uniref:Protein kinase domain-containing protein n=1 Tax=Amylocarpus encephaloides TaxID=45428 RepID=A0A9P7YKW4_9HELO|nr:hypothetical protein BJ875DRAFT_459126 [Amylocarpus encephaloides]
MAASNGQLKGQESKVEKGAKKIKVSSGLTVLPREILATFDTLEMLDLSGNASLTQLPNDISRLHKLKIAFFSNCGFKVFPKELAQCRSLEMVAFKGNHMTTIPELAFPRKLRWLILTNNEIETLPVSIGHCHRLQKCMLAGNQLTGLPAEMAHCRKLGLLRLSSNKLTDLPKWLMELPELSFLSFAGNPCATTSEDNPILDDIVWGKLEVKNLLGEGASGIISKGAWKKPSGDEKTVAIKLFKGEVTSDGSPTDEMNATITAGKHPNLIDPIGKIHGHPDKKGLVLELIPPIYTNLGLPPTLDTCTRDSFPPEMVFSVETCRNILLGIASAAEHLHERGIKHGDLYAHNILFDRSTGHALLGDFGAATIYGKDYKNSEMVELMEVFAFGHLIEDLLGLVERKVDDDGFDTSEKDAMAIEALNVLHWKCSNPVVMNRPSFVEVRGELEGF